MINWKAMWMKIVATHLKALPLYLSEGTEGNHENHVQDIRYQTEIRTWSLPSVNEYQKLDPDVR
jgi:hypothetical protein